MPIAAVLVVERRSNGITWRCGERGRGSLSVRVMSGVRDSKSAARVAEDLATYGRGSLSVGVVTPFAPQGRAILSALLREGVDVKRERIELATAHRFQGDERDVIYFSPVMDEWSSRQVAALPVTRTCQMLP